MKTLMTTTALVALLTVPVFAQGDAEQMNTDQPAATEIVPVNPDGELLAPDQAAEAPVTDEQQVEEQPVDAAEAPMDDAQPTDTAEVPTEDTNAPSVADNQEFFERQGDREDLASNWIGESIYNANDENLGDVNDILFAEDGRAQAVIVGVGGFLGLGEKDVAINFEAIEPRKDEDGDVTLYIQATAEQLEAAPEFMTLADIRAQEAADAAAAQTGAPPVSDSAM